MDRKLTVLAVCILAGLSAAASAAFGQEQQKAPRLQIQHARKSAHAADAEAVKNAVASGSASKTPMLPLFTFDVQSDRDNNNYTGVMVGADPFSKFGNKEVHVKTFIVPIVIITNTVGTSVDFNTGNISGTPGVTTFDPTANDNSCLSAPNNNPLKLYQHTPMFDSYDFSIGGVDVGHTQYIDAFQRAEFWNVLRDRDDYHLLLDPIRTLSPFVLNVPADQGITLPSSQFPACGPFGIVDIDFFDLYLNNTVLPALQPQVNAGNFPIFMLYNVVLAFTPQTNLFNCCVLGYHGSSNFAPIQTYSPSDFDTTGLFGSNQGDSNTLSHEVAEWANDPFGNNPTPQWGGVGQVPPGFCQGNLEVGDPLSGTNFSPIGGRNGFTYNLQELAFFSWFFSSKSIAIHGWFSDNNTFTSDAGPACVPAASSSTGHVGIRQIGQK